MKNYLIIDIETPDLYLMHENTLEFTPDTNKAIFFTQPEGETLINNLNKFLNKPRYGLIRFVKNDKHTINVDDLNGMVEAQMVIITRTIENADIIKFSADCDKFIKAQNPEALIYYGVNTNFMQTPQGTLLIFTAVCQYWGTPNELEALKTELRQKNLLIKP